MFALVTWLKWFLSDFSTVRLLSLFVCLFLLWNVYIFVGRYFKTMWISHSSQNIQFTHVFVYTCRDPFSYFIELIISIIIITGFDIWIIQSFAKGSPLVSFWLNSITLWAFLTFWNIRISRLINHICFSNPRCGISYFSKKLYFLLV